MYSCLPHHCLCSRIPWLICLGLLPSSSSTWLPSGALRAWLVGWPGSVNRLTVLLVLAVVSIPSLQHTIWGQFNTIGLLSLPLCYHALRNKRYALAGVWAVGLTFKPHLFLLILQFLLIWTLLSRERWRFYLGFLPVGLAMWAIAELAQPGWVLDFILTLRTYGPEAPVVEQISAVQIVAVVGLGLATLLVALQSRDASSDSSAFAGCISLTLASSCIVISAIGPGGMVHVVVLPVAVVLLLSHLRRTYPSLCTHAVWTLLLVYCLGVVGFAIDVQLYKFFWSELAYCMVGPILVVAFFVPLCLRTRPELMRLGA